MNSAKDRAGHALKVGDGVCYKDDVHHEQYGRIESIDDKGWMRVATRDPETSMPTTVHLHQTEVWFNG